jgi:hypothetical protein
MSAPAVLTGPQGVMTVRNNLFDITVQYALILAGQGIDATNVTELNACVSCAAASGNVGAPSGLATDLTHLTPASVAIGAGDNSDDTEAPAAAAVDIDGDCRSLGVVDIGADQR